MIKSLVVIAISFLFNFPSLLYSQGVYYGFEETELLSTNSDYYANNYLNGPGAGMGNSGLASVVHGISTINLNPASMNITKRFEINIQFAYKSSQVFSSDNISDYSKLETVPPSFYAAFGYKVSKHFQTGFVYSNPSSYKNDWGTRIYNYNGNIIKTDAYNTYTVHSIGIPLIFSFERISFGFLLNYSFYKAYVYGIPTDKNPNAPSDASVKMNGFNFKFGTIIKQSKNFSFGFAIAPGFTADYVSDLPHISLEYYGDPSYPWKFSVGSEYYFEKAKVRISGDYNFTLANIFSRRDRHEFSVGGEYYFNKILTLRCGFFNLEDELRGYGSSLYSNSQYFLTAGAGLKFNNYKVDLSILDSHISSGFVKNTYMNIGVATNF